MKVFGVEHTCRRDGNLTRCDKNPHTAPSPHPLIHTHLDTSHFMSVICSSTTPLNQPLFHGHLSLSFFLSLSLSLNKPLSLGSAPSTPITLSHSIHPCSLLFYYYPLLLIIKLLPRFKRESLSPLLFSAIL